VIFKTMKITVKQLRTIIKEEVSRALKEGSRTDLEFQVGMPGGYEYPATFEEFMERVEALGCTLDEFKGDYYGALSLLSGVYRRTVGNHSAAQVMMASAIEKGDLKKLERLVADAPHQIDAGDTALSRDMNRYRKD